MIYDADAAAASLQLQSEHAIQLLRTHRRRPLLHHLRAGPSWLLQLPRPVAATRRGARGFYNVLIDPKFERRTDGKEEDLEARSWVARTTGRAKSVRSVEEVHELIGEVERLAGRGRRGTGVAAAAAADKTETAIDVVVISARGKLSVAESEALLQIDSDVPVFALEEAIPSIAALEHFRLVSPIPPFSRNDPDWRAASLPPLPEWLAVSRLECSRGGTATTSPTMNESPSKSSALLFAFAVPNPPDQASSRAREPCAQARGRNSARALLHNGWAPAAPAGPTSEGAECIIFGARRAKGAKVQGNGGTSASGMSPQDGGEKDADEDGDSLLSPDAIRAVAYACPSVDVLAVMMPGVAVDEQREKHSCDSNRIHARAQKLLRARYWIDVGEEGESNTCGAAAHRRGTSDGDSWVRVANSDASQSAGGPGARWYTPWRWPGAGVRWLLNGERGNGGEARGKKRGLDESDEEEEEYDEDGEHDEGSGQTDHAENGIIGHEDEREGVENEDEDNGEAMDPWRDVQRCRLGGGESRVLL
ncbi:hypothetical protein BC567DRAFT_261974 [Phyllosticta citribraziliensis]